MANPFNGSKIGKRGKNNVNRPSRKPPQNPQGASTTARWTDAAKYYQCSDTYETAQDYVVPRRSLGDKQHLELRRPIIETETRKARQLHNGKMIETSDQRLVWKSEDTLLRRGKPDQFGDYGKNSTYVRTTPDGKREIEKEGPAVVESSTADAELFKELGLDDE